MGKGLALDRLHRSELIAGDLEDGLIAAPCARDKTVGRPRQPVTRHFQGAGIASDGHGQNQRLFAAGLADMDDVVLHGQGRPGAVGRTAPGRFH